MPVRQPQPVSDPAFWKERLELAKKQNHLHYSVYLANESLWNKIYNIHVEIIKKEIPEDARVLDIGCGYGRMSPLFKKYTGVDISPDLLAEAKKLYPYNRFILADLNDLPFRNKEFDIGFMVSVRGMIIGNLGQEVWDKMEKECIRVCKKLLILEYGVYESRRDTHDTIAEYEVL
jgi:SAM-dependent methyltransferase